jgi:hypothetical protein
VAVLGVAEELVEGGAVEIFSAEPNGLNLRGVVNVGEGIGREKDAGFASKFVEGKAAAVLDLQFVEDAREPRWSVAGFALRRARGLRKDFGEKAFDGEILGREKFPPRERASWRAKTADRRRCRRAGCRARRNNRRGAFATRGEARSRKGERRGADFVLMRNACGTEHEREGAVLTFAAAAALAVVAVEHQSEKGKLMRVAGKLAGRGVAHISENGAALLADAVDGAEEVARAHVLSRRRGRGGNICVGCSVRHKVTSSRRLHLF